MSTFTLIKPKQKYMTMAEIKEKYGKRGVVAYSCKVIDSVPQGGYVIAAQKDGIKDTTELRAYQRKLVKAHPDKAPIYFFRLDDVVCKTDEVPSPNRVEPVNEIKVKHDHVLEALMNIPDEVLAAALSSSLLKSEMDYTLVSSR